LGNHGGFIWGRISRRVKTRRLERSPVRRCPYICSISRRVEAYPLWKPRGFTWTQSPESQEELKLSTERGGVKYSPLSLGGLVAGADSARALLRKASRRRGLRAWGRPAHRLFFRQPSLSFGVFHDVENPAIFSPQRSQPRWGPPSGGEAHADAAASRSLHRRLFSQPLEFFPQRFMGRWPCPGQRRCGV
jgi:hypothetical protein